MNLSTHKKSEVDLRVAQELKNNQDFIYQTNQKLQSLTQGIVSLSILYEKCLAKCEKEKIDLIIKFENLKEFVDERCSEMESRVGDMESNIEACNCKFEDDLCEMRQQFATEQWTMQIRYEDRKRVDALERDVSVKHDYFAVAIAQLKGYINDQDAKLKKELTPEISEVDPLKKHIDEALSVMRVDMNGLVKEIDLLKRSSFYSEKKFEQVHTLISRLQEKK